MVRSKEKKKEQFRLTIMADGPSDRRILHTGSTDLTDTTDLEYFQEPEGMPGVLISGTRPTTAFFVSAFADHSAHLSVPCRSSLFDRSV